MISTKIKKLRYMFLLLIVAAIWGFAFVAQRTGMQYIGAFTFNGIRFALGSLSLLPLILLVKSKNTMEQSEDTSVKKVMWAGIASGSILFIAASLQQIGIIYTTAGKAAFITSLYIVFVPIIGIFLGQKATLNIWIGSFIAIVGLYFLCVSDNLYISFGDLLELMGALFWAAHILVIDHFSRKVNVLKLSAIQFATCSVLSILVALYFETTDFTSLLQVIIPILYAGILSVGVAYTLQVVGQKNVPPANAAIILSMETVFGALGGYWILNEQLGLKGVVGSILMFSGMLISQLRIFSKSN